ncbi:filamentous hemagglutinin N-terminal domain-containing protein [Thermoleptolyngbya sp. C42_A2020_037]|uniref:two-partner secretion domain-containing protein n=1 Tax=Thermoleptolyngbya sp. C42_A2020_037 TaxID=2747799 RepID=UPI001A0C871F|nr:filamentous hemagglutinin N-terminal domain-containing protein [Thermoleptolyngbya sp. C42_A2020_037]MBF2085959.1 filamentous hemagglutinin N-terminal domain-containing protein [Thermoleptolyngbya sp. C42_A2020_037]
MTKAGKWSALVCWRDGAIALAALGILGSVSKGAIAQSAITPDATLGAESSIVVPNQTLNGLPVEIIQGGAERGRNLFHSFQQFNVSAGRGAYFQTFDTNIANIIARVTGGSRSEILGTLGTSSPQPVNLFFINPNGILFGPQSSLNVSGSFLATTASAIQFGALGEYSSDNPAPPSPLLTVDPSALFFNQAAGSVVNQSVAPLVGGTFPVGLRVRNGQSLTLVGGDVQMEGGRLSAFGGRVEIGAVAGRGGISLASDGTLRFPNGLARGNVTLSNSAIIDVSLNERGDVGITANNIDILSGSEVLGGIFSNLGAEGSKAGNLTLNASGTVRIAGSSFLQNNINSNAIGTAGNIEIVANQILMAEGAQITASTLGRGDAGNIILRAGDRIVLDGIGTAIFSSVENTAEGNGGRLGIETGSLSLSNGAQLIASTAGRGNAGNIEIQARDCISLTNRRTIIFTEVSPGAVGNGGTLQLEASSLTLTDDAALSASTVLADGNAGQIFLRIRDRTLIKDSQIFSNAIPAVAGRGGNIFLETGSLLISNDPDSQNVPNLSALTAGRGDAGNITLRVRDRVILNNSSILTGVNENATGNGGNIRITTDSLSLRNRSQISPGTLGQGNAGNVWIRARDRVALREGSSMLSVVGPQAIGQGGRIRIRTGFLTLSDGASLISSTLGQGNAGNVDIRVRDRIILNGQSGISTSVEESSVGQGGTLQIRTHSLFLNGGSQLIANTRGRGNAGNIRVMAGGTVQLTGISPESGRSTAFLTNATETAQGRSGDIMIRADHIQIQDAAVIFAQSGNNRRGGNVQLTANQFNATGGGQVIANTARRGRAGNITLNAGRILLSGQDETVNRRRRRFSTSVANVGDGESGLFADTQPDSTGRGGSITVRGRSLALQDGAAITAQTAGQGAAGNITLRLNNRIQLNNANITASGNRAAGGSSIILDTALLNLENRAAIAAESVGEGTAGRVRINTGDRLRMRDSDITTQAPNSAGGDIVINGDRASNSVTLLEGDSDITTNSRGDGGNITIGGAGVVAFDDSDIISLSNDRRGGNITLSPFFSEPTPPGSADDFDGNDQVDLNASGQTASGQITTPDTDSVQNSLTPLAEVSVDEGRLLANSCVVRDRQSGRFIITGADGLPQRPGNNSFPSFPTGDVQPLPDPPAPQSRRWQPGEPILEPNGVYELTDGRLVLSRECGR